MSHSLYQRITAQIVAAIEAGAAADRWVMPWHAAGASRGTPVNAFSHKPYRGINTLTLWAAAEHHGFPSGAWATYKQWQALDAQVNAGEKATTILFWKVEHRTGTDAEGDPEDAHGSPRRFFARAYHVFNAGQVRGYVPPAQPTLAPDARIARADAFFSQLEASIVHGGDSACYLPSRDEIHMPTFERFRDSVSYYATLAHECTHWTGHPQRCHRDLSVRFGTQQYAAEELVAELGAAFLCADLDLSLTPRADHACYIQSWLQVLRADDRAIFTAASKAQQAVDWMHARQTADAETCAAA